MVCLKHCTSFKSDFFDGKRPAEKCLGCARWRLKDKKQTNKQTKPQQTKQNTVKPMEIIFIIIVIIIIIITVN